MSGVFKRCHYEFYDIEYYGECRLSLFQRLFKYRPSRKAISEKRTSVAKLIGVEPKPYHCCGMEFRPSSYKTRLIKTII